MRRKKKQAPQAELPVSPWRIVPQENYRQWPELSRSELEQFIKLPIRYWQMKHGMIPPEDSDALAWGSIVHSEVLEGIRNYVVRPTVYVNSDGEEKPWNSNASICRAWLDAHSDRVVLTPAEAEKAESYRRAVRADKQAVSKLNRAVHFEASAVSQVWHRTMKCRVDIVGDRFLGELKTVECAAPHAFRESVRKWGWHRQAAVYMRIARSIGHDVSEGFYFICIEKSTPPLTAVYRLGERSLSIGDEQVTRALQYLELCEREGRWPSYTDANLDGSIPEVELPDRVLDQEEKLNLIVGGKEIEM